MPTYTYRCSEKDCEHQFEVVQKISDEPVHHCPSCDGEIKRIIVNANFRLKGEKWYSKSGSY